MIPLIFVLVVLPSDEQEWLKMSNENGVQLGGNAYWYYPNQAQNISKNSFTMRLQIPLKNKIQLDFSEKMFQMLYPKLF